VPILVCHRQQKASVSKAGKAFNQISNVGIGSWFRITVSANHIGDYDSQLMTSTKFA
jgi:hypothetical protein